MIEALFLKHPRAVRETYFEHQRAAFRYGGTMLLAGLACLVHGLVPGLCEFSGSSRIARLHGEMDARRRLAESGAQRA